MSSDKNGLQFTDFDLTNDHETNDHEELSHKNYNPISKITKPENFEFEFEPDEDINEDELIPDISVDDMESMPISEEIQDINNTEIKNEVYNNELTDDEELLQEYLDELQIFKDDNNQEYNKKIEIDNNINVIPENTIKEDNVKESNTNNDNNIEMNYHQVNEKYDSILNSTENNVSEEEAEDILAQVLAQDYTVPVEGFEEFAEWKKDQDQEINIEYIPEDLDFDMDDEVKKKISDNNQKIDILAVNSVKNTDLQEELENINNESEIQQDIDLSDIMGINDELNSDINEIHSLLDKNIEDEDEELNLSNLDNLINTDSINNKKSNNFSDNTEDDDLIDDFEFSGEEISGLFEDEIDEEEINYEAGDNDTDLLVDMNKFDSSIEDLEDLFKKEIIDEEIVKLTDDDNDLSLEDSDSLLEEDIFENKEDDAEISEVNDFDLSFDVDDFNSSSEDNNDIFDDNDDDQLLESANFTDDEFNVDIDLPVDDNNEDLESDFDFNDENEIDSFEDINFPEDDFELVDDMGDFTDDEFYDELSDYEKEELTPNTQKFLIKLRKIINNFPDNSKKFTNKTKEYLQKLKDIKNEVKNEGVKTTLKKYIGKTKEYINKTSKKANKNLKTKITARKKNKVKTKETDKIQLNDWNNDDSADTWGLGPAIQQSPANSENKTNNETNNDADWEEEDISFSTADMLMEDIDLDLGDLGVEKERVEEEDNTDYTGILGRYRKIRKIILKWTKLIYKFLDSIINFEKNWWKVIDFFAVIVLVSALAMVAAYYIWHK